MPADTTLKRLAATIKARWICEQGHQKLEEELGLGHFKRRSWTGLHRRFRRWAKIGVWDRVLETVLRAHDDDLLPEP